MNIVIKTIPHNAQRYDTCGDWRFNGETLEIYVSECGEWRYEFLVAMHEAIEAMLCKHHGVKEEAVTAFDMVYEAQRKLDDISEPGDSPKAPYHREHRYATDIELFLAHEFSVDWSEYEKRIWGLEYKKEQKK